MGEVGFQLESTSHCLSDRTIYTISVLFLIKLLLLVWNGISVPDLFGTLKKNKIFWILETEKDHISGICTVCLLQNHLLPVSLPLKSYDCEEIHCSFVLARYYLN